MVMNHDIGHHGNIKNLFFILVSMLLMPSLTSGFQMSMTSGSNSNQKVAVVTGATRGIGRGIALELGRSGYKVYCIGRSSRALKEKVEGQRPVASNLELTVESIAEEITALGNGGVGIGVACDLSLDGQIEDAIATIEQQENSRLDVLVCSAYTTPTIEKPIAGDFWTQGMAMWDAVNGVGLRQVYAACLAATPLMMKTAASAKSTSPLICLVSSFGGKSYTFNVAYGVGKAAIDRLALDMSVQLKKHGVATTALYPGLVQTEANMQMLEDGTWDEASGEQNMDLLGFGESTAFSGKALMALLSLPREELLNKRSGKVQVVAELAKELDFYDDESKMYRPPSIRSLQYLLPNFVFPSIEAESGKPIPDWIKNNIPDILLPWSVFSGPPPETPPKM